MENLVIKKSGLKDFVDFAFSIKEMKEVKENNFPIPNILVFNLDKDTHEKLQLEIVKQKRISLDEFVDEFELELYGITFIFSLKK
jgi:hypothetical protein